MDALPQERTAHARRAEPSSLEEPIDVGGARDAHDQPGRRNRQRVVGVDLRAAAGEERLRRLPRAERRADQPGALEEAEEASLHGLATL